jgi:hypothetical protein
MINPFSDEYLKKEVEFYGLKDSYSKDGVEVKLDKAFGRIDDYLNQNFRSSDIYIPIFLIDKTLWMSLTWMEVQSAYIPFNRAKGKCATAGCGLGYYVLKLMSKENVESIDVYEKDQRVVDFFKSTFSDRKNYDKVNFIVGDAREEMTGKEYDHVFVDIYQEMLDDEAGDDYILFNENNVIKDYNWWCQELPLLAGRLEFYLNPSLKKDESEFFGFWQESSLTDENENPKKCELYRCLQPYCCEDYAEELLYLMGRI